MEPTREAGHRVADLGEEVEVPERMAGLTLGDGAEQCTDVRVALHVGLLPEVEISAVGLTIAREASFRFSCVFEPSSSGIVFLSSFRDVGPTVPVLPTSRTSMVSISKSRQDSEAIRPGSAGAGSVRPMAGFDRPTALRRLADEQFDLLVVGGGITGAGVALDAASRGLRTALVERDDFASGTSSKSSKMVHGGLRYLQNGDVRLVYEALAERQRLRRNAPHLVKILPFLIPILSKDGLISPKVARAFGSAMWMYDITGGARIGKLHKRLKPADALEYMPTLPADRLAGAYLYFDARADDARLTLTIARRPHSTSMLSSPTAVASSSCSRMDPTVA